MNAVPQQVVQDALPASRKVYRAGEIHKGLRVPMREITLHPSSGEAPLTVYDSSGPFTDPTARINIEQGLPRLREGWITARGDVGTYGGRPYRARGGGAVTQLTYARAGIITPEMEFVAIRENVGR